MESALKLFDGEVGSFLFSWRLCEKCGLHANRKQLIHGGGNSAAKVVIVLDRTGPKSAISGDPYTDLGGKVLTSMLKSIGSSRHQVWCTTPALCPTKGASDTNFGRPLDAHPVAKISEIAACRPRLHEEIKILQPEIIVACGAQALKALAVKNPPKFKESLGRVVEVLIQGELVEYPVPVMVTTSLDLLARDGRQNARGLWNKTTAQIRAALDIAKTLSETRR